jgi:hypothetical protein
MQEMLRLRMGLDRSYEVGRNAGLDALNEEDQVWKNTKTHTNNTQ